MSLPAKVDISLLSDEEIPTCFQVLSESFGHDAPFVDMYFPHHDTPLGAAQGSKRLLEWKQQSKIPTFLKAAAQASDQHQEKMVGFAVWTHMKDAPPAELDRVEDVEETLPDKDDREYMTRLWRDYVVPRTQSIRESGGKGVYGGCMKGTIKLCQLTCVIGIVLELLAVLPDFQRQGAGTALVQWGTKVADERGLVVGSSFALSSH
jgi:GNAT superfamily N-acetyltransferase